MPKRQRQQFEYIYGINPVVEALRGQRRHNRLLVRRERRDDRRISDVVSRAEQLGLGVNYVDSDLLDRITDGGNHQGIVLETGPFRYVDLSALLQEANGRTIVVLDHVQDPQNLATMIRSAAAVDVAGIVIQTDRSAQVTPAVVRSSAGLVEQVPIARENNTRRALDELKEAGYWVIALEATEDARNIFTADLPEPAVLVIGSEERGIAGNVLKACDVVVSLPMPGRVESLNAAVAGSIGLFELLRRHTS